MDDFKTALTNRSLGTIKAELAFLSDAGLITTEQVETILEQLPSPPNARSAPTKAMSNMSLGSNAQYPAPSQFNEKQNGYESQPNPPPPAYPTAPPAPAALCSASALYAYNPTDAGDLALMPNDRISVTEYMNAEWWKGRNERTNLEGIFPRSYVKVDEKAAQMPAYTPEPVQRTTSNNYGNMPLQVSGQGNGEGKVPSKGSEAGKKFGKKLGNAAIFGAGASIGGNIVNSIF